VQVWCKHGTGLKKEKRSPVIGGRRLSYSSETDDKLLQWVIKEQENGTLVTKDAIQLQARSLVRDECPDFKASSGWVEKFMTRHNLAVTTTMSSTNPNGKKDYFTCLYYMTWHFKVQLKAKMSANMTIIILCTNICHIYTYTCNKQFRTLKVV
jgi:hypothetical protein